jgi:hypothetical protein
MMLIVLMPNAELSCALWRVGSSARLCENPTPKVLLGCRPPLVCTGPLPSPPSGDAAHTTTLHLSTSQPRAPINRGLSTRVNTRRRLYANTVKLNSVRTVSKPRIKKKP